MPAFGICSPCAACFRRVGGEQARGMGFALPIGYRAMGDLILVRHSETEWSLEGRHTGRTDVRLTNRGEAAAAALAPRLAKRRIVAAFTSPARRAATTAVLAGLPDAKPDPDLWEW